MAVIYATLIVKGKKTINDVPPVIREEETDEPESVDVTEGVEAAVGVDVTESAASEDSTEEQRTDQKSHCTGREMDSVIREKRQMFQIRRMRTF